MSRDPDHLTRRSAIAAGLAAAGTFGPVTTRTAAALPRDRYNDWTWQEGRWTVRHRKLKTRLSGDTRWNMFSGTSTNWLILGGQGNVEDNSFAADPPYRGVAVRAFDKGSGQWSIWWLDSRYPGPLDPPMRGRFEDGVGTFFGETEIDGKPIRVRFLWHRIETGTPRWEQAFSADGGASWETNWIMDFTRAA